MQNTQKHTKTHTFRPTLAEALIDMTTEADCKPLTVVSRTLGRGLTVLIMREKQGTYVLTLKRENATPSEWEWQAVIKAWPWPTTARAYPSKMTVPPFLCGRVGPRPGVGGV